MIRLVLLQILESVRKKITQISFNDARKQSFFAALLIIVKEPNGFALDKFKFIAVKQTKVTQF